MADSTEYNVWEEMAKNFKNKEPYKDNGLIEFLCSSLDLDSKYNFSRSKLLDLGCSIGLYDQIFIDAGFKVTGIDQIEYSIKLASQKVPKATYIQLNAKNMNFKQKFNVVFTNTVLQHMKYDLKISVIKNIYNALVRGGLAFICECTFDKDNWNSVPGRSKFHEEVTDGYSFTVSGWIKLFEQLNFEFVKKHKTQPWYLFRKKV